MFLFEKVFAFFHATNGSMERALLEGHFWPTTTPLALTNSEVPGGWRQCRGSDPKPLPPGNLLRYTVFETDLSKIIWGNCTNWVLVYCRNRKAAENVRFQTAILAKRLKSWM